jgi:RHS repeat-associated protein
VIGGNTSTYAYNGDGLRMSRTAGGATTNYVWDVAAGLPVVLQDGTNTYVYGLDLIASVTGTTPTYYLYDGLGSTSELANSGGTVTDTYRYDVFGAVRTSTGSSAQPFRFTGEQRDSESGMYYLRARYYDPATGRFLSQDPLMGIMRLPLSQSRYPYVLNNPANLLDRSGLCVFGIPCPGPIEDAGECIKNGGDCVRDPIASGAKAVGGAMVDLADCVTDVSCSAYVSRALDRTAATLSGLGAGFTNSLTLAGCAAGAVGCMLGKGVGEIATSPLRAISNFASIGSTAVGCTGRFFGDEKEGGGFTRSNIKSCTVSAAITGVGFIPESNIDAIAAGYQLCRSEGFCPP